MFLYKGKAITKKVIFLGLGGFLTVILIVGLVLNQVGVISAIFSNKNPQEAQTVTAAAFSEDRSPQEVQDLIENQKSELAELNKDNQNQIGNSSDNFKQSNIKSEADQKRINDNFESVPGEFLLKVKPGKEISGSLLKEKLKISDVEVKPVLGLENYYTVSSSLLAQEYVLEKDELKKGNRIESVNQSSLKILQNSGLFEAAIPNFNFTIDQAPNDTNYRSQWYLNNQGNSRYYNDVFPKDIDIKYNEASSLGISCSKMKIAVLDTGVDYEHPDLKNTIGGLTPAFPKGFNALDGSSNADDDHYHGSHVAGIIAAETNNNEGMAGICPGATIVPVKVLNAAGSGSFSNVLSGLSYAVNNGADIINMSLGGNIPAKDPSFIPVINDFQNLINTARNKGSSVVVAAGNSGMSLDGVSIDNYLAGKISPSSTEVLVVPAALNNTITVGASDREQKVAKFSNFSTSKVEVLAPGVSIFSAIPVEKDIKYANLSGTSMASPVVAGVIGSMKSKNPSLTYDQIIAILQDTSFKNPEYLSKSQSGSVNMAKAIVRAVNPNAKVYAFNDYTEVKLNTETEINFLNNDLVPNSTADYLINIGQPKNGKMVRKNYPSTTAALYTPNLNFTGTDSFTYSLVARAGEIITATVFINVVQNLNSAPVAKNALFKVKTGTQSSILNLASLVSSSSGIDASSLIIEEGLRMEFSGISQGPEYGQMVFSNTYFVIPTGKVFYDQFSYSILGKNGVRSNVGYITLEVSRGNYAPRYNGYYSHTTNKNTPLTIDVVSNSTDPDNDAIFIDKAVIYNSAFGQRDSGKIEIINNKLVYTPPLDKDKFNDYIDFTLRDTKGATSEHILLVSQTFVPSTEIIPFLSAVNLTYSVYETEPLKIYPFDLVKLDEPEYQNCLNQETVFKDMVISRQPTKGTLTIKSSQNQSSCNPTTYDIIYTAFNDSQNTVSTTDSFEFRLGAASHEPKTGTVTLNIFDKSQQSSIKAKAGVPPLTLFTNAYKEVKISDFLDTPIPELNLKTFAITKKTNNHLVYIRQGLDYIPGDNIGSLYIIPFTNGTPLAQPYLDSFEFTISGPNTPASLPIKVNLDVRRGNESPKARTDYAVVEKGGSVLIDVLANDTDADGDPLTITRLYGENDIYTTASSKIGKREIVTVNGKQYLKYTNVSTDPDVLPVKPGQEDRSYTTYVVTDGKVPFEVKGKVEILVNSAPIVTGQINQVSTSTTTKIDLANTIIDHFNRSAIEKRIPSQWPNRHYSEINYDSITYLTTPTSGQLSFDKNTRQFVYVPNPGVTSIDEKVQIKVKDLWGAEATGFINLSSKPPVLPTTTDDTANVDELGSVSIDVLANDTTPDADIKTSTVNILSQPQFGNAVFNNQSKQIVYTSNKEITTDQTDSIIYTITDSKGQVSNIGTVTVNIKNLNIAVAAPVANNDNFTIVEGSSRILDLLANDTFKNQDIKNLNEIQITQQPQFGILDKDPKTGSYIFTQTKLTDLDLNDIFKYKILDNFGNQSKEAEVKINIRNTTDVASNRVDQTLQFRNKTSGNVKIWQVDGLANQTSDLNLVSALNTTEIIPSSYRLAVVKNIDTNTTPDSVFENTSNGKIHIWYQNQNIVTQKSTLKNTQNQDYVLAKDYQVVSAADFNRDGSMDLLIFNAKTGQQMILYINNNVVTSVTEILVNGKSNPLRGWQLITASDFNADNKPDVLFYNPWTGEQVIWILDNQNRTSISGIFISGQSSNIPSQNGWKISTLADFNGDGVQDFLWFNYITGETRVWIPGLYRSNLKDSTGKVVSLNGWQITATADFNQDKKADIVIRNNTTGEVQILYMNGEKIQTRSSVKKAGVNINLGSAWFVM